MGTEFGREVVEIDTGHKGREWDWGGEGGGDVGMGSQEGRRERALWMRTVRRI